jgi:hypothetical protein
VDLATVQSNIAAVAMSASQPPCHEFVASMAQHRVCGWRWSASPVRFMTHRLLGNREIGLAAVAIHTAAHAHFFASHA